MTRPSLRPSAGSTCLMVSFFPFLLIHLSVWCCQYEARTCFTRGTFQSQATRCSSWFTYSPAAPFTYQTGVKPKCQSLSRKNSNVPPIRCELPCQLINTVVEHLGSAHLENPLGIHPFSILIILWGSWEVTRSRLSLSERQDSPWTGSQQSQGQLRLLSHMNWTLDILYASTQIKISTWKDNEIQVQTHYPNLFTSESDCTETNNHSHLSDNLQFQKYSCCEATVLITEQYSFLFLAH